MKKTQSGRFCARIRRTRTHTQDKSIPSRLQLAITLIVTLALCGCASRRTPEPPAAPPIPGTTISDRVDSDQVGSDRVGSGTINSNEIAAATPNSDRDRAIRFLADNLPLPDRLAMTEADRRENLDFAFLARQTMPWGHKVPWDIFAHYVLPHRTSQEPFQAHRPRLFRELAPLCASAASMEEALSRISAWTLERVRYTPTSRRDLGVISVLDGGRGRCEELNILFMAAARSVGLPVRQALTPWWQHADGNHAWVEAWTETGWHFLETSAFFTRLDQGWFAPQTPRMAKVAAFALGHPQDPARYRVGPGFALIDTTPTYTQATRVRVRVAGRNHAPVADREVYFSIWSAGGLRPVTKTTTDATGRAQATLGPGVFFVTCATETGLAHALLDTRNASAATTTLFTASSRPLPDRIEFAFPGPGPSSPESSPDPDRDQRRAARDTRYHPLLAGLPPALREHLQQAGQRIPDWLAVLHDPARSPWLEPAVLALDDKDLLQADPRALDRSSQLGQKSREYAANAGLAYDDDIFVHSVLASRLYLEPWSDWRTELAEWSAPLLDRPLRDKIGHVRRLLQSLKRVEGGYFGPMLTPGQILACRRVRSDAETDVMLTAGLRALGVPARMQPDLGGVEYFDGRAWQFWAVKKEDDATGIFRLRAKATPSLFTSFGVARVNADGYLDTLDDLDWNENELSCALRPGGYVLLVPTRKTNETVVELRPFQINPRAETVLEFPGTTP